MKRSTDRILTTHVGSLPRPQEVVDVLFAQDRGEGYHATTFEDLIARGVHDAVRHQAEAHVDVMSDGEMSKISYAISATGSPGLSPGGAARDPAGSGRVPGIPRPTGQDGSVTSIFGRYARPDPD